MAIVQSPPGPSPSMLNRLESDFDGGGSGREGGGGQKEIKETLSSWLRHKHLINQIILGGGGKLKVFWCLLCNPLLNYNNTNLVSCFILLYWFLEFQSMHFFDHFGAF